MAKVDTVDWKAFRLRDLFEVLLAKGDIQPKQISDGDIPLVSAGNEDNGIVAMIDATGDGVSEMFPAGCISVSMFGRAFYQTEAFYAVSHGRINVLKPMRQFSYEQGLFITSCLNRAFAHKFDYATMCTQKKLMSEMIHLPATPDGQPDWAYMDAYMSEVLKKEEVFAEHLASLTAEAVADGHKLDTSGWKAFRIGELFEVLLAKGDIQPKQVADGTIPLVSAGNEDNGIVSFIDAAGDGVSEMFPAGCITVSMFGKAFYQPECFYAVSHGRINVLRSKIEFSSIVGAFLAACLSHVLGSKYDYATMCTQKKLVNEEIYLPVTADGQPDWTWMEQYMQQQMDKAEALVEHLDAVWN